MAPINLRDLCRPLLTRHMTPFPLPFDLFIFLYTFVYRLPPPPLSSLPPRKFFCVSLFKSRKINNEESSGIYEFILDFSITNKHPPPPIPCNRLISAPLRHFVPDWNLINLPKNKKKGECLAIQLLSINVDT